jgi:hypothetical protein
VTLETYAAQLGAKPVDLSAFMDMDVFDSNSLLAFAAMPIQISRQIS